jgi:hypothetical protein
MELSMAEYLLVDDRDGSVIAELTGAEQAARLLSRLYAMPEPPPVGVVKIDRKSGQMSDVSSVVGMRPLSPPVKLGR